MPKIDCFTKFGAKDLQDRFEELVEQGMPEKQAARQVVTERHKGLHDELNALKKEINKGQPKAKQLPIEPYKAYDPTPKLEEIKKKYEAKENILQKQKENEKPTVQPQRDRNRTGRREGGSIAPLEGAPIVQGATGPDPNLVRVAEKYARENGIELKRQSEYAKVDEQFSKRIADAYEKMPHAPNDPKVKEAYQNLIAQTISQYKSLVEDGYVFSFYDSKTDPYNGNPYNAMRDLRENKKMAVYGTYDGYGTDGVTAKEIEDNPMLSDTGIRWKDQNGEERMVTANDLFRAVHDAFGHGLEGAGFRARGEENAWQAHVRLFTGSAVAAITTETRGQNSWLNFGPYGDSNRNAKVEDTVFAEQKTGLMPKWTWEENRVGDAPLPTTSEPQVGDTVMVQSKHTKGAITYFRKEDGWYFTDTRGKQQKESPKMQETITQEWKDAQGGMLKEIRAFHGSPHSFGKFTTEKIGTGEGAQAFGWGLYFTDLESIARTYAKKLANISPSNAIADKKEYNDFVIDKYEEYAESEGWTFKQTVNNLYEDYKAEYEKIADVEKQVKEYVAQLNKQRAEMIAELEQNESALGRIEELNIGQREKELISKGFKDKINSLSHWRKTPVVTAEQENQIRKDFEKKAESFKFDYEAFKFAKENIDQYKVERNLYKVSLHKGKTPDQYTWLEWDMPLTNEKRNSIIKAIEDRDFNTRGIFGNPLETVDRTDTKGKDVYESLAREYGQKQASLFLLENGIDGVKYPAESIARGATSDTARGFNYVVFDENAVEIEEQIQFEKATIETEEGTESIDTYIDKAKTVLKALFPDAKFEVYETQEEYEAATGDSESRGGYFPKDKRVVLNLEKMREDRVAKTPIHEVVHPIVREAMASDENALTNLWVQVQEYRDIPGMDKVFQHIANYEGTRTQAEEGITEFITRVVDGTIDPSKMSPSLASKFIDLINKLFEALGINIQFGTPTDLKRLSEAVKSAFETGDVAPLERVLGRRIEVEPQGQFALADKATPEILQDKGKFESWVKRMVSEYDATVEEMVDAIKEDYPDLSAEEIASYETRIRKIVEAPKKEKPKEKATPKEEKERNELTGISHAETEKDRIELGLPEYVKTKKTNDELEAEANEMIQGGVDIDAMIAEMEKGIVPTDVEYVVLSKFKSLFRKQTSENPTNENINKYDRLITALEKIGSIEGRAFAARKYLASPETTLVDYLVRQKQESGVDVLTSEQIEKNKKEFEEIEAARKAWEVKYEELLQKYNEEVAKQNVGDARRGAKKTTKTKEDFQKERKDILDRIKEKLKKKSGQMSATIVPYADVLIEIAPDVAMLMKSYIEQGVVEFSDLVKRIHTDIKNDIPEIQEGDVVAIIAGEYSKPKQTKNQITAKLNELRQEAKIMQQIAELEAGNEPSTEVKKVEKNRRLKELKDKLKEYPAYNLAEEKKRLQREIDRLEKDLKDENFLVDKPKQRIKLDAEARALKDKLVKLKTDREVRLLKEAYQKRSKAKKAIDIVVKVLNVPRSIMASMDFSAPLRQAIIATYSNPRVAASAAVDMFNAAFSQKTFDEWFYDLEQDPNYELMKQFKLGIADPKSPFLKAKEEVFMDGYAEKIPGVGELIKGSERAYVMYLNKMRVDVFNRLVDRLAENGKTPENSPEVYEAVAKYVNNITGRGSMGAIEQAAPVLSVAFFSPRLMASRLNLLNPVYFYKLPSELKKQYLKDIGTFVMVNLTILGLLYVAMGGDDDEDVSIELDPRSSDFMKVKMGNTRWDIWGGFQQYARLFSQMFTGQRKSAKSGEVQELDGEGPYGEDRASVALRFVRSKLAPVPSSVINLGTGRDVIGQRVDAKDEGLKFVTPLLISSVIEAAKDDGMKALFTVGVPSIFGVGVETQKDREREISNKVSINGQTAELTEEQHAALEKKLNIETKAALEKVRSLKEYKDAEKKLKASMESVAKEIVLKKVRKDYIQKNINTLKKQIIKKDETEKQAKSIIEKKL